MTGRRADARATGVEVTLAVVATPELPTRQLLAVAEAAQASGLTELWLWEDVYRQSAVAQAGAVLGATEHLRVGLGVLPVPLRHAVLAAMDAATLVEMFPGRLTPGIGHGVQTWMGEIGARVASPLTLLREHAAVLRPLLHGEPVTIEGRYVALEDARLVWPPAVPPPLYVGAHGPRTLRLAGEVGDGVILQLGVSPEDTRAALRTVDEGRAARGAHGWHGWHGACVYVGVDAALRAEGPARTAAHLRRWVDAGATTVAVVPVGPAGTPDMADAAGTAAWLGSEVRPLLVGEPGVQEVR